MLSPTGVAASTCNGWVYVDIVTDERLYTVDGELLSSDANRIEVDLGLRLRLAVSATAALPPGLRRAADAVAR